MTFFLHCNRNITSALLFLLCSLLIQLCLQGGNDPIQVSIYSTQFFENDAEAGGGGALTAFGRDVLIQRLEDSLFRGNHAMQNGGAVEVDDGASGNINNTIFMGNSAIGAGGALAALVSVGW